MVAWDRVTRADVVRAMKEYDRVGPKHFFSQHVSPRPRLMSWPGKNAVTHQKQSWAQLLSSQRATDLVRLISRAGRQAP
jgi:hypothetical protein